MIFPDECNPAIFHEDVFYAYFLLYRHLASRHNIWGGHGLETFGEDSEIARNSDLNFVWTVLDCGEGADQWIVPGLQFVSRICYVLTEVPYKTTRRSSFVLKVVRARSPGAALAAEPQPCTRSCRDKHLQ